MTREVFVSYSSHDKAMADAAVASIESAGIRCWKAPRDIIGGSDYGESIMEAIEQWQVLLLIYSSFSDKSMHVSTEPVCFTRGLWDTPSSVTDFRTLS